MKTQLYDLYWQWVSKQRAKNQWHESAFTCKSTGEGWITDEEGEMVAVWDTFEDGITQITELIRPNVSAWERGITLGQLAIRYPDLYREFQMKMKRQGIEDYSSYNCFSVKLENGKPVQCVIGI